MTPAQKQRIAEIEERLAQLNRWVSRDWFYERTPYDLRFLLEMVRERDRALEAIIIRCEEGDKRSDWLPTIASIAKHALEPKLVS